MYMCIHNNCNIPPSLYASVVHTHVYVSNIASCGERYMLVRAMWYAHTSVLARREIGRIVKSSHKYPHQMGTSWGKHSPSAKTQHIHMYNVCILMLIWEYSLSGSLVVTYMYLLYT